MGALLSSAVTAQLSKLSISILKFLEPKITQNTWNVIE